MDPLALLRDTLEIAAFETYTDVGFDENIPAADVHKSPTCRYVTSGMGLLLHDAGIEYSVISTSDSVIDEHRYFAFPEFGNVICDPTWQQFVAATAEIKGPACFVGGREELKDLLKLNGVALSRLVMWDLNPPQTPRTLAQKIHS